MSTHNLCFRVNVYPCKPQFYYIKVGCKGAYISRTRLHDEINGSRLNARYTCSYMRSDTHSCNGCREIHFYAILIMNA